MLKVVISHRPPKSCSQNHIYRRPAAKNNNIMCSQQGHTANGTPSGQSIPLVGLPTDADIVCGRGRGIWTHQGNLKFKYAIESNLEAYSQAVRRKEKSNIINHVMNSMLLTGARFVKKEDNIWCELDENQAREKTAHAMRDFLKSRRKGSTKKRSRDHKSQQHSTETKRGKSNPAASMKRSYSDPSPSLAKMSIFDFDMFSGAEASTHIHSYPEVTRSQSYSDLIKSLDLEPTPILEMMMNTKNSVPRSVHRDDERLQLPNVGNSDPFHSLLEKACSEEPFLGTKYSSTDKQPDESFSSFPDFC